MARDRSGEAGVQVSGARFEVDVPGLKGIAFSIRHAGKDVRADVRKRLKKAGEVVAVEIRKRTPVGRRSSKATPRSSAHRAGTLAKKTSVRPGATSVRILNTALQRSARYPKGYRYGKRIEFDPTYNGRFAFFYPGYEAKKDEAIREVAKVLDDVGREFAQGGTPA